MGCLFLAWVTIVHSIFVLIESGLLPRIYFFKRNLETSKMELDLHRSQKHRT